MKKTTKKLEDMTASELSAYIRKLGKPRTIRRWGSPIKETIYPNGYQEALAILRRKTELEEAEHRLGLDKIYTEMSVNRAKRASKDLHSRAIEPVSTESINPEFNTLK